MDRIFTCGNSIKFIMTELTKLLHEKKCVITNLQAIKIEEGQDLHYGVETFSNIMELSEIISKGLETFKSACIMIGKGIDNSHLPIAIMYLMFMKTDDQELFDALSTI